MKKMLSLTLLALSMSLTSCAHHGCKGGKQCEMSKEKCADCKGKESAQCPMKDGKMEEKKEEVKK
jgi:hypothetical protein